MRFLKKDFWKNFNLKPFVIGISSIIMVLESIYIWFLTLLVLPNTSESFLAGDGQDIPFLPRIYIVIGRMALDNPWLFGALNLIVAGAIIFLLQKFMKQSYSLRTNLIVTILMIALLTLTFIAVFSSLTYVIHVPEFNFMS